MVLFGGQAILLLYVELSLVILQVLSELIASARHLNGILEFKRAQVVGFDAGVESHNSVNVRGSGRFRSVSFEIDSWARDKIFDVVLQILPLV